MCVNSLGMHSQKPIPVLEAFDGLKPLQRHRLVNGLFTAEAGVPQKSRKSVVWRNRWIYTYDYTYIHIYIFMYRHVGIYIYVYLPCLTLSIYLSINLSIYIYIYL